MCIAWTRKYFRTPIRDDRSDVLSFIASVAKRCAFGSKVAPSLRSF